MGETLENLVPTKLSPAQAYFVSGAYKDGTVTKVVTCNGVQTVPELFCTHEEADTRIFLHAWHVNQTFERSRIQGRLVIRSLDTDVLVLAVYYFQRLSHVR